MVTTDTGLYPSPLIGGAEFCLNLAWPTRPSYFRRRYHTRLFSLVQTNYTPGISPFTGMEGVSPLHGVLRDACRPFDDSDPLPKSLHGLSCLFFYVWRVCGPVPPGWSVWHISNCYHWSLVLYCSEFHTSQLLKCLSTDRPAIL